MAGSEERQIRVIVEELEEYTGKIVTGVALEIHAVLTEDTPLDTGWARANWVPAVGRPGASSSEQSGNIAAAQGKATAGLAAVAGYKLRQGVVHVTNNVPYIEVLNAGSSKQAPADFVPRAIEKGIAAALRRLA